MRAHVQSLRPLSPPAGVASRAWWLARWLLVLLLVWDQVGSPLHRHHHDSGVDGRWLTAAHETVPAETQHVEDADADLHFAHAVMAVLRPLELGSIVSDGAAVPVFPYGAPAMPSAPESTDSRPTRRPDKVPPPYASHRSLPPAGRAPPLHA